MARCRSQRLLEIATQIARTLAVAHAAGVVHRDIKPENIIITPAGAVKVLDFGLARFESPDMTGLTQTGAILGTPAYMSPEQTLGRRVDFKADIFALGVILYEMASGTNPFAGRTVTATLVRIADANPPPLSDTRPDIPPDLDRIVARCLRKDPEERFGSTEALADDLALLSNASPDRHRTTELGSAINLNGRVGMDTAGLVADSTRRPWPRPTCWFCIRCGGRRCG